MNPEFDEEKYKQLKELRAGNQMELTRKTTIFEDEVGCLRTSIDDCNVELAEMEAEVFKQMREGQEAEFTQTRFIVNTGPRVMKPVKGFEQEYFNLIGQLPPEEKSVAMLLVNEKRVVTFKPEGVATITKICEKVPFLQDHKDDVERILGVTPGRRIEKIENEP